MSQRDVAARAAVSQQTVSRVERGHADRMRLRVLRAVVDAVGATLAIEVRVAGERALRDQQHAQVQSWLAARLRRLGWLVEAEVSFNHYGDRGRVDLAAHHPSHGVLLIVEVKSRIDDVQDVIGRLDVKARVGNVIARERGWPVSRIVPALVIADGRTARRRVVDHAALFSRFAVRSRAAWAWVRRPEGPVPSGHLLFVTPPSTLGVSRRPTPPR